MGADSLGAEDAVVVPAGDDTHESAIVRGVHAPCPAVGAEWEDAGYGILALRLGFIGRKAGADDFGLGEAHRGDGDRVEAPDAAGDDLGDHLALRRRLVFQHRLAGQIADRPYVLH